MRAVSLDEVARAVAALPAPPRIVASGNFATPTALLAAVDAAVPEYRLHMLNAHGDLPDRDGVTYESAFVGPAMRHSPRLTYVPSRLSLVPVLLREHLAPDLVLLHTSTPRSGTVSLGIEVNILPAAIEAVRERGGLVVAQVNPRMPFTFGDSQVHESDIDLCVEVDEPVRTHDAGAPDGLARVIGDRIASQVVDGSTLQLGIGAVPDAVLASLTTRRGLRVWSEMFSDGALDLERAGALDANVALTASFLFGSQELYDWVDANPRVHMLRTERTNDPAQIARQPRMTSVNAALQVDLYDQANASRIKGRIYSGIGGSSDFIVGALHSHGGRSFIALPSWHPKADVSTIVPRLTEPVTHMEHSAVVTENGLAPIFGRSQRERVVAMIEQAAHPDARDELRDAAQRMDLL